MKEELELKEIFSAAPSKLYEAWLDSEKHGNMIGGNAQCSSQIGATFSIWDGYITGKNISFKKDLEIVQSWRTTEFGKTDEDSLITITFNRLEQGTEMVIKHTNIPAGQTQYKKGWQDHYFLPMKTFF